MELKLLKVRHFNIFLIMLLISFISCKHEKDKNVEKTEFESSIVKNELGKRIDSLLNEEKARGFSGSVLVATKEDIILKKGYGFTDSTKSVPIEHNTKFYIASTTKGITGVVAILAEENNIISLDSPLKDLLQDVSPPFSEMTLHSMLTHTSGLRANYKSFGSLTPEDNISLVYDNDVLDNEFNYTGAGYWFTAAVIEKLSGNSYESFVREKLFDKLQMQETNFWFEVNENDNKEFAQKLEKFPPEGETAPNWGYMASGGVISNVGDLYKYQNYIFSDDFGEEKRAKLFGPHITLNSGIEIGYGWYKTKTDRDTNEYWSRGGESFGHNASIRYFVDEDVVIIIVTNCGDLEGDSVEANRSVSNKIEELVFNSPPH